MRLDNKYIGTYQCRESAARVLALELFSDISRTVDSHCRLFSVYEALLHPKSVTLTISAGRKYPLNVYTRLFQEALLDKVTFFVEEDAGFGTSMLKIVIAGYAHEVYYAMWWVALLVRLINNSETIYNTCADQIKHSALTTTNYYQAKLEDRVDALVAYEERATHNRYILVLFSEGPASHSLVTRSWENYKIEYPHLKDIA